MAIYTVHMRTGAAADPFFVKDGFSWPGFFFTLIWLAIKRMWIVVAFAVSLMLAVSLASSLSGNEDFWRFLSSIVLCLILGFEGNDLRRWSLAGQGYREVAVIEAQDLEEAELKYFDSNPDIASPPAPPSETLSIQSDALATDALGLFGVPGGKP
jgi:Protein of unknown function (DUF2628)